MAVPDEASRLIAHVTTGADLRPYVVEASAPGDPFVQRWLGASSVVVLVAGQLVARSTRPRPSLIDPAPGWRLGREGGPAVTCRIAVRGAAR
jgi:hypothetical protein